MKAVVSLGANIPRGGALAAGEDGRRQTLQSAVEALGALCATSVVRVSSLYETVPVGYTEQPLFLNAAVELETKLSPRALLGACLGIEAAHGRVRTFANAPRTLDIDLLGYEGTVFADDELTLPHPRLAERAFVLIPLTELYPNGCAPGFSFSPCDADDGVRLWQEQP